MSLVNKIRSIVTKKLEIPGETKTELTEVRGWIVSWTARNGDYSASTFKTSKMFLTKEHADKFANALKEAFDLIQNTADEAKSINVYQAE